MGDGGGDAVRGSRDGAVDAVTCEQQRPLDAVRGAKIEERLAQRGGIVERREAIKGGDGEGHGGASLTRSHRAKSRCLSLALDLAVSRLRSTRTDSVVPTEKDRRARSHNAPSPSWSIARRSEEHTSELQSLMRISYAVFCLKKKNKKP